MNTLKFLACFVAPLVINIAIFTPTNIITKIGASIATIGLAGMAQTSNDN